VPIEVVPATADRVDDVVAILGATACWCTYYRLSAGEYGRIPRDGLAEAVRRRSTLMHERLRGETAPGMLAYLEGTPVGWCGIGPRAEFTRLRRSRTIPSLDERPVWSIVCFLVRPGLRRRGVATALLSGAIDYARSCGAPALEAYPVDTDGRRIDTASAYVGTTAMFEAAGFRRVTETTARSAGLARWVMRLELTS
jgi:GNAT superfamily N-acetyltransferase